MAEASSGDPNGLKAGLEENQKSRPVATATSHRTLPWSNKSGASHQAPPPSRKPPRVLKEHALRSMHFLYSAAHLAPAASIAASLTQGAVSHKEKNLARFTPALRKSFCGKCRVLLVPGNTAKVRLRNQNGNKFSVITCNLCRTARKFKFGNKALAIENCPVFGSAEKMQGPKER